MKSSSQSCDPSSLDRRRHWLLLCVLTGRRFVESVPCPRNSAVVVGTAVRRSHVIGCEYRHQYMNSNSKVYVSAAWLQRRVRLFENMRVVYRCMRAIKCERLHTFTNSNSQVYPFVIERDVFYSLFSGEVCELLRAQLRLLSFYEKRLKLLPTCCLD